jgi:hypothetical protein
MLPSSQAHLVAFARAQPLSLVESRIEKTFNGAEYRVILGAA